MVDANALTMIVLRWVHLVAGITWIGLLYYFNVVQVPAFKTLDGGVRSQNIQRLVPRALFYFRYGALVTVLAGFLLLYMLWPDRARDGDGNLTPWSYSILAGALLGLIMLYNVWAIIWPNQKKVIQANVDKTASGKEIPAESAQWAKNAFFASRANLLLSFPMLYFMAAASHGLDTTTNYLIGAVVFVLGAAWLYVWTHMKPTAAPTTPPTTPPMPR